MQLDPKDYVSAIRNGDEAAVIRHAAELGVNTFLRDRSASPLTVAIEFAQLEIVRTLLATGADPRFVDTVARFPPLLLAVDAALDFTDGEGNFVTFEIIRLLLEHGADVFQQDALGQSAHDYVQKHWTPTMFTRARMIPALRPLIGE